jgi:hypothetical protein
VATSRLRLANVTFSIWGSGVKKQDGKRIARP